MTRASPRRRPRRRRPSRRRGTAPGVLVSAHRCGAGAAVHLENTREALDRVLGLAVDFVEFDVQRLADGTFVLFHDEVVRVGSALRPLANLDLADFTAAVPEVLRYDDVLAALAGTGKQAHVDLKFRSPAAAYAVPGRTWEVAATRMAVEALGPGDLVVTTLDDDSVRAVRDWADAEDLPLLVGLSLGRSTVGLPVGERVRIRTSEVVARPRVRESRANVVVAHQRLARAGVRSFARRVELPLLVWTVDDEDALRYWLRPGRAWLVTTNEPERALRVREEVEARYRRAARARAARRRRRARREDAGPDRTG